MIRRATSLLLLFLAASVPVPAQEYASFDVRLRLDFESAERTVEIYQGLSGNPQQIAQLRGSQIALATTAYLTQQPLNNESLVQALEAAKFNQLSGNDIFRMREARERVAAIRELLTETERRNFGQRVVSTVEQLFPSDARISTTIPVYFVAFGQENVDAFVRRVVWRGDTPTFVGEGQGELTIVVNLAKSVSYGRSVDERFVGLLSVVAHEVFHAAFGVFKDGSPFWRNYYATHDTFFDQLADLTQNEGIAYYLSLVQHTRGQLPGDWEQRAREGFSEFNARATEILSPQVSPRRALDIIRLSNSSNYWGSYGAVAGMIIARQIDQALGRTALMETIARGPGDFFGKYAEIMKQNSNVPPLASAVVQQIGRMR